MKPIVALYKTYRGGEWFDASLESVRRHVAGVVAVTTELPWLGHDAAGGCPVADLPENCRGPLSAFSERHPEVRVTDVRVSGRINSEDQYRIGLATVRSAHPDAGVLIVDTDEVWDDAGLGHLRSAMSGDPRSLYFRSGIRTYVRSPLYRVAPAESARPVVGLANPNLATGKSRFSDLGRLAAADRVKDVPAVMHHFGYVRLDVGEIMHKLTNTSAQDGTRFRPRWMEEVWDHVPNGRNVHPTAGAERCWPGLEEVGIAALPAAAVESPTFWMSLSHHRGGVPRGLLTADDPAWRGRAESDAEGVPTTAPPGMALCVSAALTAVNGGRTGQDEAIFLTPRLRMSFRETAQLAEHARDVPPGGRVLEIGSGLGGSMAVIGCCAPADAGLVAVDPYVRYDEENVTVSRNLEVGTPAEFWATVNRFGLRPRLVRSSSGEARRGWGDAPVDLLLVDGNHSYDHVLHDLIAWWPVVRPGGTLLAHDLSGRFPGVVRAVREFERRERVRFNLPLGSTLAWVKKEK